MGKEKEKLYLVQISDNEGAEYVWDTHLIKCTEKQALKYCEAKANEYMAENGDEPDEFVVNECSDMFGAIGFFVQYNDHHVAVFATEFSLDIEHPLSGNDLQQKINEGNSKYREFIADMCEDDPGFRSQIKREFKEKMRPFTEFEAVITPLNSDSSDL